MFQPNKIIKSIAFVFGVIALSLGLSYAVLAVWQEPTLSPPDGNVDAPLNTSAIGQTKIGGLILNTGGATTGLLVQNGNVGIGTINPGAKLHVLGISNVDTKADNIFVQGISDVASNNPAIEFRRSKGNSYPGNAVVFDDMLGEVVGEGYDGVSWPEAANIRMSVDGPVAVGKVPARFDFLTRDNSGNYSSRMTIKNDGNVGIGTTDPQAGLEVSNGMRLTPRVIADRPACNATNRGTFWFVQSPAGTADKVNICVKRSDDVYEWQDLMRKGSTCDGINIFGIICVNY